MRAGSLRERITLLSPGVNEWGEPGELSETGFLSAKIEDKAGGLDTTAGADTGKRTLLVTIRYRSTLQGNEWLRWFGQDYRVTHIQRDPKRRFMVLTAEREA